MMQARLKDGSIVDLLKDCSCVTHEGPHWIHADNLYREANKLLLNTCTRLASAGFAIEEQVRLQRKLQIMNAKGIVEILR
ncbi:MAG: hypothetical protein NTX38_05710 [Methylobacter sp.]|jgi:hypothetical protein|nr:hypothetical protein [Methylobacter sp.]